MPRLTLPSRLHEVSDKRTDRMFMTSNTAECGLAVLTFGRIRMFYDAQCVSIDGGLRCWKIAPVADYSLAVVLVGAAEGDERGV